MASRIPVTAYATTVTCGMHRSRTAASRREENRHLHQVGNGRKADYLKG